MSSEPMLLQWLYILILQESLDRLPDPVKSSLVLHKYAQVRDVALLQSISDCMDSRLSLKEIRKAGVSEWIATIL